MPAYAMTRFFRHPITVVVRAELTDVHHTIVYVMASPKLALQQNDLVWRRVGGCAGWVGA